HRRACAACAFTATPARATARTCAVKESVPRQRDRPAGTQSTPNHAGLLGRRHTDHHARPGATRAWQGAPALTRGDQSRVESRRAHTGTGDGAPKDAGLFRRGYNCANADLPGPTST